MEHDSQHPLWEDCPDAVIAASGEGKVLFWNSAAEVIFGYSAHEAAGRRIEELLSPPNCDAEPALPVAGGTAGPTEVYETVRQRKDGTLIHINVTRRVSVDASGVARVLYMKKDVTPLKVRRDSRLVQARFGALLELTPDALVIVNAIGRIVLVNSQAANVFGYQASELIGQPVETLLPERYRITHGRDRARFFSQPRARAMGRGLELLGRRSSGEEFPVEISLSPLETDEGTMVMSAVRDIADRKRAEQKFRALLESAPDAMVIVARNGRISLVNSQTEKLFGYAREELLGQPVEMLVPERFRANHGGHRGAFFHEPRWPP